MNHVALIGRLTRPPEIRRTSANGKDTVVARYSLAVDRIYKRDGEPTADFIRCVTFGKTAEFTEKYLHQGSKIAVEGRISTGSYTDKDGKKVYTTDVIVERCEFAESKREADAAGQATQSTGQAGGDAGNSSTSETDFMNIPSGLDEEEIPFV